MSFDPDWEERTITGGSWRDLLALAREIRRDKSCRRSIEIRCSLRLLEDEVPGLEPKYRRWLRFSTGRPYIRQHHLCADLALRWVTILLDDALIEEFGKPILLQEPPIAWVGQKPRVGAVGSRG